MFPFTLSTLVTEILYIQKIILKYDLKDNFIVYPYYGKEKI